MNKRELALLVSLAAIGFSPLAAQPADPQPAVAIGADYLIGIEDELQVFVWGEPELSLRVKVRPDGKITVPLVNDLVVVGLKTDRVREFITEELSKFIRDPNVTVILQEINSYRVYFLGEIQRQGALEFYRPTTLLQGIAAAGGLTEFANKQITLLRVAGDVEHRTKIDYKKLVAGDPNHENLILQPGDTLLFN